MAGFSHAFSSLFYAITNVFLLVPSKICFPIDNLAENPQRQAMCRVICASHLGEDAGDLSALENPQSVEEIDKHYLVCDFFSQ
ncbi:MAG: hypothetical protein LH614_19530 [Pyrinomonadaceae bacterium]|nr:hypothetical protein [Pyrinomonadaceae bacterium]